MKNKKSLLSLGLLALILTLAVGYAAVSSVTLEFGGTASVKSEDLKVDIASASHTSNGDAKVAHTLTQHSKKASFAITDMVLNEEVKVTYVIDNHETDVIASLTEAVELSNDNKEHFSATYKIVNAEVPAMTDGTPGTTTVEVTVKMIQTPIDSADNTATISFELTAAPSGNTN